MQIADYSLSMQASHSLSQQNSVKENLRVWVDSFAQSQASSEQVSISSAAQQQRNSEIAAANNTANNSSVDPLLQVLILLIEKMTGQKVSVFDASQLQIQDTAPIPDPNTTQSSSPPLVGYGVSYSNVNNYSESEQTTFQATGTINTTDGKSIQFNLNLVMQRQYSQTPPVCVWVMLYAVTR
jgi:hypothetical protein